MCIMAAMGGDDHQQVISAGPIVLKFTKMVAVSMNLVNLGAD
jgi:hypothetical protein